MTVTTTESRVNYAGNGVATDFVIPYPYLSQTDIVCTVDGTLQVLGTDYTISGDNTTAGSTLSFTTAPGVNAAISIVRETPPTQLTEYTPFGPYKAEQHESDFDKAALLNQEHSNDLKTKSDIGHDHPDLYYGKDESDARFQPIGDYALQQTRINSGDPQTLNVAAPTLADDVTLTPITNTANGLAKLDGSGNIPISILPAGDETFLGGWDASGGGAPPAGSLSGEYYVVSVAGTVTATRDGAFPTSQATDVNDRLIWDASLGYWWLFPAALGTIIASSVLYDNTQSGLTASEVQAAVDELAAGTAGTDYFEGRADRAYVKFDGRDAASSVPAGWRITDPRVGEDNPSLEFTDSVENVLGLVRLEDSYPSLAGKPIAIYADDDQGGLQLVFVASAPATGGNSRSYLLADGEVAAGATERGWNVYRGTGATIPQTRVMFFDRNPTIGGASQIAQLVVDDTAAKTILQSIAAGYGLRFDSPAGTDHEFEIGNVIRFRILSSPLRNGSAAVLDSDDQLRTVGFNEMKPKNYSGSHTLTENDAGDYLRFIGAVPETFTLPTAGEETDPGATYVIANAGSADLTIEPGVGGTLTWFSGGTFDTGARALEPGSVATVVSIGGGSFECWGQLR